MATKNIQLQDSSSNVLYPQTDSDVVLVGDSTLTDSLEEINSRVYEDSSGVLNIQDESENIAFRINANGVNAKYYNICDDECNILKTLGYKNKTIAIIGDSWGQEPTGAYGSWVGHLRTATMFATVQNYSLGGARYTFDEATVEDLNSTASQIVSANNVFWNQLNRLMDDINNNVIDTPDIIFMMGDTNDRSRTLGSVSDAFSTKDISAYTASQLTNFAISMRYTIEEIMRNLPTTKILVSTPALLIYNDTPNTDGVTVEDFNDMTQSVCEYMGVECLRADKNSGINIRYQNTSGDEFCTMFLYNGYDQHLNDTGAEQLAHYLVPNILKFLY